MSQEPTDSDNENNGVSNASITFDVFETYYKQNPDLDNAEYYQKFPSVNTGTIRSWKAKAKSILKSAPPSAPETPTDEPKENKYLDDSIAILKKATRMDESLLKGLDKNAQYKILKNMYDQIGSRPDPNIRLMTPSGTGVQKLGIEQYMSIDEKAFKEKGFGEVNIRIPASKLFNPEKSKELITYK